MDLFILFYIFIIGTLIGSFLNVVSYRIPREESISFPPSHCPNCNNRLKFYDLIPIFSYIALRGKCRNCKNGISIKYPIVEMITGLLFVFTVYRFGLNFEALQYLIIIGILIPVFLIDLEHSIIPDGLNIGILVVSVISVLIQIYTGDKVWSDLLNHSLGLLLGGGFFLLIAMVTNGAMGGGDIKIMGALGFLFGVKNTLLLMFLSFVIGGVLSLILLGLKIKKRKDYIPFGPFICIAALITIFWGQQILQWYLA
ncbi:MAG: prepilin peptidase [Clostridium sp.]|nr:prepilin peptidase [Clostridium sp.]